MRSFFYSARYFQGLAGSDQASYIRKIPGTTKEKSAAVQENTTEDVNEESTEDSEDVSENRVEDQDDAAENVGNTNGTVEKGNCNIWFIGFIPGVIVGALLVFLLFGRKKKEKEEV